MTNAFDPTRPISSPDQSANITLRRSGVFASFDATGRRLRALDAEGRARLTLGAGAGLVAASLDELTVTAGELARGLLPAEPFLVMGQYSMGDETRMPPGKETT